MGEILQASLTGFTQVFGWPAFGLMLIGIAVGFAVGILPGLGGPTTLALMLPFIFRMTPVEAFSFLLGMVSVTATTGDITSILFGVPGEGTASATVVDGHPMAKNGEAGRALGAVLMSSLIGALFGAFALALAIPIVQPLVLSVGSPELFMFAILGTTMIAALSGRTVLKGLIAGAAGFLLAMVGLEATASIERYTFSQLFLWDGVGLLPVTLGLFAIPETIDLAVQGTSIARRDAEKLGGVMEGVKDTFRHGWLVLRCSAIGTYIGVIPGMGGSVSQWAAYAHAAQSVADKSRMGKGAIEGVLGPGAANNATLGGALVPTVAFGVPGSLSTAILLGAFLIQGLVPGPPMLIPEANGGHLSLTFSMVWLIVISNLITVGICFLFLEHLAKITFVRGSLLIPFILFLIYLGAFAEKNAFEDMAVMLIFGAVGWAMVKLDWPRPPLLLGLVLGPLAENRLFLSLSSYGWEWMTRPGVMVLFVLMLAGILYPAFQKWRFQRRFRDSYFPRFARVSENPGATQDGRTGLRFTPEAAFSLFLALFFATGLWMSLDFPGRAGLFPWIIGGPGFLMALVQFGLDLTGRKGRESLESMAHAGAEPTPDVSARRTLAIWGWIVGLLAGIWFLGFAFGVLLVMFLYLKAGAREGWGLSLALSGSGFLFVHGLMDWVLKMPLPEGLLWSWF
ncbi:MAG: tripartite tricarboxylate transporter permease [Candidatus Tectomicrobia bacterium]|uniref:Tripartite tricarboxylate transporter permease n=1 Tax=Tectimicrobiota bacterium TaxID=2528274 RepID=A0A932MMU2_UNCTE|nr:tripartite tricarboxylate transporter permease [Candidatus Tectomicrobia bacterium]